MNIGYQPWVPRSGGDMDNKSLYKLICSLIETVEDAEIETQDRVKQLIKMEGRHHRELAYKLMSCIEDDYCNCNSLACKQCVRTKRIKIIESVTKVLMNGDYSFCSLVLYRDVLAKNELNKLNPQKLKAKLYRDIKKLGIESPMYGALEVVFEHGNNLWLPHFHLFLMINDTEKKMLNKLFKKRHGVPSWNGKQAFPIRIDPIDYTSLGRLVYLVTYVYKFMWQSKMPGGKKCRGERMNYCDSLHYLDSLRIETLLVEHNVRRKN